MKVLFVASECAPFVKTGGLGDVVAALPRALSGLGIDTRLLLPAYPALVKALGKSAKAKPIKSLVAGQARLLSGKVDGLDLLLLDVPQLYDRPGNPYTGPGGKDWPDNDLRFAALGRAAADIAAGAVRGWVPDVVHAHDWQAGLAPAYMRFDGAAAASVTTIHNIAFQGLFAKSRLKALHLPAEGFIPSGFEFFDQVGFLKAGIVYADKVTTVSPTYHRELMSPAFGMGLEGVLAARHTDFCGILNGIDLAAWNPLDDPHTAAPLTAPVHKSKSLNKRALEAAFGLPPAPKKPLFCVISRLTWQKGLDLLVEALPALLAAGGRLVLLGSGDAELEHSFKLAAKQYPEAVAVKIGYDEPLSHLMQAGADAILVPSRFEPCGLTQLYGLRYGTLPVVARTGGLADTVIDANDAARKAGVATGFQFHPVTLLALIDAIEGAVAAYADRKLWRRMVQRAMAHAVGWDASAKDYAALYAELANKARGAPA